MTKVLNITEEGRGGGALGRIRIIAKALDPSIKTAVVYPGSAQVYGEKLEKDAIIGIPASLHPMTKSGLGATKYLLSFIPEIIGLIKIIRRVKPDLIHANGSWQIKGILAGWLTRRKTVWHMNDSYQPFFVKWLFKMLAWMPTRYVFASERTKEYYEGLSPRIRLKPNEVIAAPVDSDRISMAARQGELGSYRFLTVGYINIHKGIELLLEAAAFLKGQQVSFDVVGPVLESQRSYMKQLEALKANLGVNNVRFLGYQKINNELLKSYDYYLCSSIREASPMAVWEAMASGLPIVSTDVGDVRVIMDKYRCGVVAKRLDGISLAESITILIGEEQTSYTEMSLNARRAAEECFSTKEISKKYLRFYTDLTSDTTH